MKSSTKKKLKEIYKKTKIAAKKTKKMVEKVGKEVHAFSESTARQAYGGFDVHEPKEEHYLDLTGKRPKRVLTKGRFDWNNLGVRF